MKLMHIPVTVTFFLVVRRFASLFATGIIEVEILGGFGRVVFCGRKLVTVGQNVSWLKCESPNEAIISIALETPLSDIETEAICAAVMRISCLSVAQIEKY